MSAFAVVSDGDGGAPVSAFRFVYGAELQFFYWFHVVCCVAGDVVEVGCVAVLVANILYCTERYSTACGLQIKDHKSV